MMTEREARGFVDAAFTAFVETHQHALKRYALALTGSDAAADDLLQASLAKLYLAWGRIEQPDAALAYARRVLARTQASWWRRASSREYPTDQLPERAVAEHDRVADADLVWRALARLGPRQRAVVVLRFYADLSEPVIADELGISVGTVKSQLARALAHLRTHLAEEDR